MDEKPAIRTSAVQRELTAGKVELLLPKRTERQQNAWLMQYEPHKYLDSQGRSGDSLRANVTSSLSTEKTELLDHEQEKVGLN